MFWVYALLSLLDGSIYVGMTEDFGRRWKEHTSGKVLFTRRRLPLRVIYLEPVTDRRQARRLEKYLKSGDGRRFLAGLVGSSKWELADAARAGSFSK